MKNIFFIIRSTQEREWGDLGAVALGFVYDYDVVAGKQAERAKGMDKISHISHPQDEPTTPDVGVRASYNVPIGTWPIPAPESNDEDEDDDRGTLRDLIMRECASRTTGTVGGVRRVVDGARRTDLIDLLRCVSLYHLIKLLLLTILLLHKLWFPHQLLDLRLQPFQLFDPLSRLQLNVLLDALVRLE
ncbi:hypothetical protein LWI29_025890 [Acer saccharum]|uniref:Uncharacterized protein n=1 Tax=Acer saccharum TaxID=4024 RepID=A0AA39T532_ACESA|nr:hypothetical protein LWI29_025890 [Acer saccharum]